MKTLLYASITLALISCNPERKEKSASVEPLSEPPIALAAVPGKLSDGDGWRVFFGSRRGVSYGMDSDSSLEFYPPGRVRLIECGYVVQDYEGIVHESETGTITCEFARYASTWPAMKIHRVGTEILLTRADDGSAFHMGDRSGATETSEMQPFWPFAITGANWASSASYDEVCPCCRYVSLSERGYEDTCLICFWKDYGVHGESKEDEQLDAPTDRNSGLTLRKARQNFDEIGACDPTLKKFVLSPEFREKYKREHPESDKSNNKPVDSTR